LPQLLVDEACALLLVVRQDAQGGAARDGALLREVRSRGSSGRSALGRDGTRSAGGNVVTLSRQQFDALRYVSGRRLYAKDINEGNGNRRRSLLALFKIGLLDWDPIYGSVVLTPVGKEALKTAQEIQRANKIGVIDVNKRKEIDKSTATAKRTLTQLLKDAKAGVAAKT
jgi:hypothetical protein